MNRGPEWEKWSTEPGRTHGRAVRNPLKKGWIFAVLALRSRRDPTAGRDCPS